MARTWVGPDSNGPDNKPENNNETSKYFQAQVQTWGPGQSFIFACLWDLSSAVPLKHAYSLKRAQKYISGVRCWTQKIGVPLRHLILHISLSCALGSLSLLSFQVKGSRSILLGKQCWHNCTELNDRDTPSCQCCLMVGTLSFTHSVNTSVSQVLPLCTEAQTMEAGAIYLLEASHPCAIMPLWKPKNHL